MQKIKFKIEYKPLADANINKHKNFDGLMAMYAAAPKLNFFQKLFKNKWTMFSGGIIIGSAITLLVTIQNNNHQNTEAISDNFQIAQVPTAIENNNIANSASVDENKIAEEFSNAKTEKLNKAEKLNSKEELQSENFNSSQNKNPDNPELNSDSNEGNVAQMNSGKADAGSENNPGADGEKKSSSESEKQSAEKETAQNVETHATDNDQLTEENHSDADAEKTETKLDFDKMIADKEADIKRIEDSKKKDSKASASEASAKVEDPKKEGKQTFSEKLSSIQLFDKDSTGNNLGEGDSAKEKQPDTYINRYAQLSFFTPLGTNGIDSYKYSHHISFNIIQGYNGAVNGFEFGGVINADRGYVNGGQFAGVINAIGGDVKGFQGAGVGNFASSVTGFQGAGVMNIAIGNVTGFQGAGVMNITAKKVAGFQAAGVMNVSVSTDTTKFCQAAGVLNFSLAHSTGIQAAGVLNIANDHTGSQIGLINVAKNVHGVQIGLINIADSIDGVSIGLLSFSKNGIFDVDLFTNDLFAFNGAIRVGGPSVYNIFAFGVSPFADTTSYGYGLGIGGHIPVKNNFFVDIDGMTWDVHKDQFEFNYDYLHMNNQLRVMPGYTLNKYISFYAGPVLNVEIYDNDIVPLHDNPVTVFNGPGISTALSFGYVAGVKFF